MIIPEKVEDLTKFAQRLVEICRVSVGSRASAYHQYGHWIETGNAAGGLAICNLLYSHIDRLHSHLYSATDLKFSIDYENYYETERVKQAEVAAEALGREWERRNIDTTFGHAVKVALSYGAALIKQVGVDRGEKDERGYSLSSRVVMPWMFGVYNETCSNLFDQEAMCETMFLSEPEIWRRIQHLPDADKLMRRIRGASVPEGGLSQPASYMHQVLSTAVLQTDLQNATSPMPGGIVQLTNSSNAMPTTPEVGHDVFPLHEIWVKDDERGGDYCTIQIVEPDILITPRMKRGNLFCADHQPYTLICPNEVPNYFWGRSEIVDLQMLQDFFNSSINDIKRLLGVQFDKLLAFAGDGISDEQYEVFRTGGYIATAPGTTVSDLTPALPEQALNIINMIEQLIEKVSGFANVLSGRGEQGVRAGVHAETLLKTASPRLRDRALATERQCATAADNTLAYMESKDKKVWWTDPEDHDKKTDFLLSQLPSDRRVVVDSHSTSPIYRDDHEQLIAFGVKSDIIGKEDAIDMLPFPNKAKLKSSLRKRERERAQMVAQHPELLTGGAKHGGGAKR